MATSVTAGSSRQLPASPRSDSTATDVAGTERAGAAGPVPQEAARAFLHDEVVPSLTAAMLRLHLLVQTCDDDARPLATAALTELEQASAGIQRVMAQLAPERAA
ncbi:MAG: hypothetical protein U0R50_16830 [Gaiellales bacterium]